MDWSFSEHVLSRRGALSFSALEPLAARRTAALLDGAERLGAERRLLAAPLLDRLFAVIPQVKARRELIELQRDLFNGRRPDAAALESARAALDAEGGALLERWIAAQAAESARLREAEAALEEELAAAREALALLAGREDLRQGLQLSGQSLFRSVERFARDPELRRSGGKKARHAEATLVSYLYRMAGKTSPFGAFTALGLHREGRPIGQGRRLVRLSRAAVDWLEALISGLEECREALPFWLNSTARILDGKVDVFVPGQERFVRLPATPPLRAVIEALSRGGRPPAALAETLIGAGVPPEKTRPLLDKLVEVGLLERGLGLPDQDPRYPDRLAERVAELPGPRAAECARALRRLCQIERAYPEANVERRTQLLAELRGELAAVAAAAGAAPPGDDEGRSLIYEDVSSAEAPRAWDQRLLAAERESLVLLQQLLPLFDDSVGERLGLYDLFAAHHGPAGRCDDLLAFYQVFARQDPAAVSALMTGAGQPWALELQERRRAFCAHLAERMGAASIALDPDWLRDFVRGLPAHLPPWPSASYGLQFATLDDGPALVLNNVMTGHGWASSRFCELFEGEESLRELVSRRLRRRQADLVAVLGMNTNLHPRLSELEVIYPGCRASGEALTLRDLALVGDPAHRRIRLVSRRDGLPLELVPLNFLFPAAAPGLYRFLCALAPIINYRGGIWSKYLAATRASSAEPRRLPRLQVGRVVLDRRTVMHPVAALPPADVDVDRGGLSALVAARRWRERLDLPREGFFRLQAARAPESPDWVKELRTWALAARTNRLRKPHYLDFDNPLLVNHLFRQLRGISDGVFVFQECLPATADLPGGSAEEHFLELDIGKDGHEHRDQ